MSNRDIKRKMLSSLWNIMAGDSPVLATSLIRLIFKFYAGFSIRESSFYSQRGSSERFFGKHTDHK